MDVLLKQEGYDTHICNDGFKALEYLQENQPDLILLDVMMPGLSGFDVCTKLKEDPKLKDIPVIFVTARDDSEAIRTCFSSGGSDYASKPLRVYEFLARVNLQIESHRNLKRAMRSETALADNQRFLESIINDIPGPPFSPSTKRAISCSAIMALPNSSTARAKN